MKRIFSTVIIACAVIFGGSAQANGFKYRAMDPSPGLSGHGCRGPQGIWGNCGQPQGGGQVQQQNGTVRTWQKSNSWETHQNYNTEGTLEEGPVLVPVEPEVVPVPVPAQPDPRTTFLPPGNSGGGLWKAMAINDDGDVWLIDEQEKMMIANTKVMNACYADSRVPSTCKSWGISTGWWAAAVYCRNDVLHKVQGITKIGASADNAVDIALAARDKNVFANAHCTTRAVLNGSQHGEQLE